MSREADQPDDALQIARAFAGLGPAYYKWVQSRFAESGVSFARMKLLGVLHRGGPKIMSELSEELGVTARNVTALVDALERDGYVRRVPHATDRRATVIELTATGMEHGVQMAADVPFEAIAELFRQLALEEQNQLLQLITKLQGLLAERGFRGVCLPGEHPASE
jgi:DNA-binding MarR family transcriptional regulator